MGLFSPGLALSPTAAAALAAVLLGELFFCLVVCLHSFIQGKICLARAGLGGSDEGGVADEEVVDDDPEFDELLAGAAFEVTDPAAPPAC